MAFNTDFSPIIPGSERLRRKLGPKRRLGKSEGQNIASSSHSFALLERSKLVHLHESAFPPEDIDLVLLFSDFFNCTIVYK